MPFTFLANVCGKQANFKPLVSVSQSINYEERVEERNQQFQRKAIQATTPYRPIKFDPFDQMPQSREEAFSNLMSKLEQYKKGVNHSESMGKSEQGSQVKRSIRQQREPHNDDEPFAHFKMDHRDQESSDDEELPQRDIYRPADKITSDTAMLNLKITDMPYPELFDRSERTFAATFAKYGDLSYYTPVQRIGTYMDHTARLKKKHILDLIAFLKSNNKGSHQAGKDEEQDDAGGKLLAASKLGNYLEHTLFVGLMPEEDGIGLTTQLSEADQEHELLMASVRVYDPQHGEVKGLQFAFNKVWSLPLMKQAYLSVKRYLRYVDQSDMIRDEDLTRFNAKWMQKALTLIPDRLLEEQVELTKQLFSEVFTSYARCMRQSIMDYILLSPQERKRLHILMLPRKFPSALESSLMKGGFSLTQHVGQHQRKLDNENDIKVRLLVNNVVTSSLLAWNEGFSGLQLVILTGLGRHLREVDGEKSVDINDFLSLQKANVLRTGEIMKQLWHRGCVLITKKFKYLLPADCQPNKQAWIVKGRVDSKDRKSGKGAKTTYLQQYSINSSALLEGHTQPCEAFFLRDWNLHESIEFLSLRDIRQNQAYKEFVRFIGGLVPASFSDTNGYDILAKDYKREIKYTAGNLMQLLLRNYIDESIQALLGFFDGIPTLNALQKGLGSKPLRTVEVQATMNYLIDFSQLKSNHSKDAINLHSLGQSQNLAYYEQTPKLELPNFCSLQDHTIPIFKLALTLRESGQQKAKGFFTQRKDTEEQELMKVFSREILDLVESEESIIRGFEALIDDIICSFKDLMRPEFCKVSEISQARYDGYRQEAKKARRVEGTKQGKNQTAQRPQSSQQRSNERIEHFVSALMGGHKDGLGLFKRYMGRIQLTESEVDTKILHDTLGVFARPFIEKYLKVASVDETCYRDAKAKLRGMLQQHFSDAKQTFGIFRQFKHVIDGTLLHRVLESFSSDLSEDHYSNLVKELRYLQSLVRLLPIKVSLPLFEVDLGQITKILRLRIEELLRYVFGKFEQNLISSGEAICSRYLEISVYLKQSVISARQAVDMDHYKNQLILEMTTLRERVMANRSIIFFILRNDQIFTESTWHLIRELHNWPHQLGQLVESSEERHKMERNAIENTLIKRKDKLEGDLVQFEAQVKEAIGGWGDLFSCRLFIGRVQEFQTHLDELGSIQKELEGEELILNGYRSHYDAYQDAKEFYEPHYQLWTVCHDALLKKRHFLDSRLIDFNVSEFERVLEDYRSQIAKLIMDFRENKKLLKVLSTLNQELSELFEYLPIVRVICRTLPAQVWRDIQVITQSSFNYEKVTLNEVKYLNFKEHLQEIERIIIEFI